MSVLRLFIMTILMLAPLSADANPILWSKLHEPGHFAIMRHASAPGTGDPENFKVGEVKELPALNSFYQRYEDKAGNMKALRAFIAENAVRESNTPIILVTHQVTISALTGTYTRQGETVIFRHIGDGEVEIVGKIPPAS